MLRRFLMLVVPPAVTAGSIFLIVGLAGWLKYGEATAWFQWLNGGVIIASSAERHVGTVQRESTFETSFQLRNVSSEPVTIIGGETT
jgi:hypothetical protein